MSTSELATSYAALILADDGVEITADKLQSIVKAAKVDDIEPIWTTLFAKALEGKDVKDLLLNIGSGGGAGALRSRSTLPAFSDVVGAFVLAFIGGEIPPSISGVEVLYYTSYLVVY
jgi:large subunit ribosomal protein LP1